MRSQVLERRIAPRLEAHDDCGRRHHLAELGEVDLSYAGRLRPPRSGRRAPPGRGRWPLALAQRRGCFGEAEGQRLEGVGGDAAAGSDRRRPDPMAQDRQRRGLPRRPPARRVGGRAARGDVRDLAAPSQLDSAASVAMGRLSSGAAPKASAAGPVGRGGQGFRSGLPPSLPCLPTKVHRVRAIPDEGQSAGRPTGPSPPAVPDAASERGMRDVAIGSRGRTPRLRGRCRRDVLPDSPARG